MTLVELVVAMLLAAILITGLFYLLSGQRRIYTHQFNLMESGETLWSAMEYIQGQVRRAGHGFNGCPPDPDRGSHSPVVQMWDGQSTCTSASCIKPSSLEALRVSNGTNLFTGKQDGTDSITVAYSEDPAQRVEPAARLVTRAPDPGTAALMLNSARRIRAGDLLVIWPHGVASQHCLALESTTDAQLISTGRYQVRFDDKQPYNPPAFRHLDPFPADGYSPGVLVRRVGPANAIYIRHFALDNRKQQRAPDLVTWTKSDRSDLQVIADGIEDFQVAWACDADRDGKLREGRTAGDRTSDEWAFNASGDTIPRCSYRSPIQAVRVTLISRTHGPGLDKKGYRPSAEDRVKGVPDDDLATTAGVGTFTRGRLTTVIRPRNILKYKL